MDTLIQRLNEAGLRYMVFGGQAVRLKGMPRFSMDWDILIPGKDRRNIERINELLSDELDEPLLPLGERGENLIQTYQTRWGVVQFHLAAAGIGSFDEAERRAVRHVDENGVEIRCLCSEDLLATKEAASRPQDQADIEFLRIKLS